MKLNPDQLNKDASLKEKESLIFFKRINKKRRRELDSLIHELHAEAFQKIDCLACANCCKTLGPRITDNDIMKLSKALKLKPGAVIDKYLKIDEDNDTVFKTMPCPFLMPDNYCMVYEHRPKACREYPHTDRINFLQIAKLSVKNSHTCPAVYEILEQAKKVWK